MNISSSTETTPSLPLPISSSSRASETAASKSEVTQGGHHEEHAAAMIAAGSGNEARLRSALGATGKKRSPQNQSVDEREAKQRRLEQAAGSNSVRNRPRWMDRLPTTSTSPDQFGWRHKLVTTQKFRRVKEKLQLDERNEVYGNLSVRDMVRMEDKGWTANIFDCTTVILANEEKGSMGHFIPDAQNLNGREIEEAISEDFEKLTVHGQSASVSILGGIASDNASRSLYEKVKTSALTAGARIVSEIWGRKEEWVLVEGGEDTDDEDEQGPRMRAIFDTKKRTTYLSVDGDDAIHSLKGIAYWYENFHIASPHVFEAQGKIFTAEEANRIVRQYKSEFKPDTAVPLEELNEGAEPRCLVPRYGGVD